MSLLFLYANVSSEETKCILKPQKSGIVEEMNWRELFL